MKFSMSWLCEHLETDASPEVIAETLTMIGLELEKIEDPGSSIKEFVVAEVEKVEKHPNADRLKVCTVNNGKTSEVVVCGAPNVREGMKSIFAGPGNYIPGIKTKLKKSKIRGVTSNGMLLSEKEIGLSEDHEGIIELADDAICGMSAPEVMGLNDTIFEIAITPNRGDCLGVRGIARDLSATGIGKLIPLDVELVPGEFTSPISVKLDFDQSSNSACPYFVGRYFKGVKNGESPSWIKERLSSIGLRPISALVDITNYFTYAYGRPLHVFDADKVEGDVSVRLSRVGEKLLALDGKEYTLDDQMTVIASGSCPEALAGVMGGQESGCTSDTRNVFLEAAYFDPVRTAKTGRKLNLQSDARFRFERGVDSKFQADAAELATNLILEICGGEASKVVVAGTPPNLSRKYVLQETRIKELGGVTVPKEVVESILGALGFDLLEVPGGWECGVPSWRHDVLGEADLVEEVLRIHGFDKIPATSLMRQSSLPIGALDRYQARRSIARRFLVSRGITEVVTFSFMAKRHAELFGGIGEGLELVNPISSDLDVMRPSILPNLISAVGKNHDRGIKGSALFEIGPQYYGRNPGDQLIVASGVRAGVSSLKSWAEGGRSVDFFDAKADIIELLLLLGLPDNKFKVERKAPDWYHPGRSCSLNLGTKNTLANLGEIHPSILSIMDIDVPLVAFELYIDQIPFPKGINVAMRSKLDLSPYQAVERDFSFVVDSAIQSGSVIDAIKSSNNELIRAVRVFDLFKDQSLGSDKKSIGVTVELVPLETTFTDSEIEFLSNQIIANVEEVTGGTLRV